MLEHKFSYVITLTVLNVSNPDSYKVVVPETTLFEHGSFHTVLNAWEVILRLVEIYESCLSASYSCFSREYKDTVYEHHTQRDPNEEHNCMIVAPKLQESDDIDIDKRPVFRFSVRSLKVNESEE